MDNLKIPPHSIEAEQSVLGGLMLDNSTWMKIAGKVSGQDFYRQDHREIFNAIESLAFQAVPFDVVTLSERMQADGSQVELAYLGAMAKDTPSAANIEAYADIISEKSRKRGLISASAEIAEMGFDNKPANISLNEAQEKILSMAVQSETEPELPRTILKRVFDDLEKRNQSIGDVFGLPSGFVDYDRRTCGFDPADLIIIAGRPSMGKTCLAMNIAEKTAISGGSVLIFSLETSKEKIIRRTLASVNGVSMHNLKSGKLSDDEWAKIASTTEVISQKKLIIDDCSSPTITELQAKARKVKHEHGLDLVIIDYLQLIDGGEADNRTNEIAKISRGLKALAKQLDVPVIALSQLNRGLENRPNKRPNMADLRESGQIEQDADIVTFIYRDEVYNPDSPHVGIAELITRKIKEGEIGTDYLVFQGKYLRFQNFTGDLPVYQEERKVTSFSSAYGGRK